MDRCSSDSNVEVVLSCCGEEGAKHEDKALDLKQCNICWTAATAASPATSQSLVISPTCDYIVMNRTEIHTSCHRTVFSVVCEDDVDCNISQSLLL